jgi:phosphoribosylanthranilate isomerase
MVKVKICGITNWTDARNSFEAGADFLGFNFYRESPRYIAPRAAARIIKRLPRDVKAVGVFVNETEEKILATVRIAGLHQIQLHGDESAEMVERLRETWPVIRAIKAKNEAQLSQLSVFGGADAFLLDTFDPTRPGGTGQTFDWRIVRRANITKRLFLAGGLTPENIAEAIRISEPYAVDVCSGVEAWPGKKDPRRVIAFMRAARATRPVRRRAAKTRVKVKVKVRKKT